MSVRTEGHALNSSLVSRQRLANLLARGDIPEDDLIVSARCEHLPIGTKSYRGACSTVKCRMHQPMQNMPWSNIPEQNGAGVIACCQGATIWTEDDLSQMLFIAKMCDELLC